MTQLLLRGSPSCELRAASSPRGLDYLVSSRSALLGFALLCSALLCSALLPLLLSPIAHFLPANMSTRNKRKAEDEEEELQELPEDGSDEEEE